MKNKKGITLIALVITIIVLLILVAISVSVAIGPDGLIQKSQGAKLENRYATINDKIRLRETALEMAFAQNISGEHHEDFIQRLVDEGLLLKGEYDEKTYKTIYLDEQSDGTYRYTINVTDGTLEGKKIIDAINSLPDADEPGNEYLKNLTLIIETTVSNTTVTLPISNTTGLTINWNSINNPNNFITPNRTTDPTYVYSQPGEYEVQIKGIVQENTSFGKSSLGYYNNNLVGIKYWGENNFTNINKLGLGIRGNIPTPSRNSFENVKSFSEMFYICANLTGKIPENLFDNCPNVTTFKSVFLGCENLTGSIPTRLFSNCPNVTSFEKTFYNCTNLTGRISPGFFDNCQNTITFQQVFAFCAGLTGSIPKGLFDNCSNVTDLSHVFYNCSGLTGSIPTGLFDNCPNVTTFSSIFYTCSGLTKIPAGLFDNCPDVTSFVHTFFNCVGLTEIPAGLFDSCPNVTNFNQTFAYSINLEGMAPDLWNRTNVTNFLKCFEHCTKLSNYNSIPSGWK